MLSTLLKLKKRIERAGGVIRAGSNRSRKPIRVFRIVRPTKVYEKQAVLCGQKIDYTLRLNPRSKSIRFAIHAGGDFIVTAPPRISQKMIEQIVLQKQEWIVDKIEYFKKTINSQGPGGRPLPPRKTKAQQKAEQKAEYTRLKKDALKIAMEKVHQWNAHYNFKFNKISIKNQKTRWGSCSKDGNLNFNYKIALLPEKLADYLVVHEICHLGQFNHSAKFWDLVGQTIPDYMNIRKELKGIK